MNRRERMLIAALVCGMIAAIGAWLLFLALSGGLG
jgi:hypothetical protein